MIMNLYTLILIEEGLLKLQMCFQILTQDTIIWHCNSVIYAILEKTRLLKWWR